MDATNTASPSGEAWGVILGMAAIVVLAVVFLPVTLLLVAAYWLARLLGAGWAQ